MSETRLRTPKPVDRPRGGSAPLSARDSFLLSCIDGTLTDNDLALATGLDPADLGASLLHLEALGFITMEESATPRQPVRNRAAERRPAVSPSLAPAAPISSPAAPVNEAERAAAEDAAAMAEDVDVDEKERRELIDIHRKLDRLDHYALLGVDPTADKKAIKKAYFERAARFHPDRHFRKRLGSFKVRMEAIFSRLTIAHDAVANPSRRAEYDAYLKDQRRLRGIEQILSSASAEAQRVGAAVEDAARSQGSLPPPGVSPAGANKAPSARPAPTNVSAALRRESFARRLLGGRQPSMPPPAPGTVPPPAMTTTEAMDALRRRYEDRVLNAKSAEARRYVAKAEQALATDNIAAAASALQVAATLAPDDDDLKRRAREAQAKADAVMGETYVRQAQYEEQNDQWPEAMRSWSNAARLLPNDAAANERAAAALVRGQGDLHEAVRLGQRACTLDAKNPKRRVTLANTYLAAGLPLNARRELETAAALAPQDDTIGEMLRRVAKLA